MSDVKAQCSTLEVHWKLRSLNLGEGGGIPGVEVKFVDIRRNTRNSANLSRIQVKQFPMHFWS